MSTLAKAKDHFQHDLLKGFQLHRNNGYVFLLLEYKDQFSTTHLVDARDKKARAFKTFEAAIRAAEEIGFSVDALFSPR